MTTRNSFQNECKISINFKRNMQLFEIILKLIETLFNFTLGLPFIMRQFTLCSIKTFSLLKHCKQHLQKYFMFYQT